MSDSSSDTTHEAILHNVVSHQLRFARQLQQLQTSVSSLQQQLNTIQEQLQILLAAHGHSVQSSPVQTSDLEKSKDKQ
jgi:TolA-binding protein